ncbi:chromosomal replication initiator protein DnaA [Brachybacterium huguangmaarense]|uniref:Chromosomal replication initiator protein DnaA n=1 Tax=Brachybacterium huguangmaarense TaxID=1652028 RepID=A0ABY6G342_9MICO|nr:chromosomal replication initiator protein DnaA [Brachybacterium huguangmaarense]UYG17630.1 chromosomal replication initiator protein DnaA [Brachybacterium huguangmaarense]
MDDTDVDYDAIWDETLRILRRDETVTERVMAFLTLSRLMAVVADTALLAAPSAWAKDVFEQRIAEPLKSALSEATGRDTRFAVTIDETLLSHDDPEPAPSPSPAPRPPRDVDNAVENTGARRTPSIAPLPETGVAATEGPAGIGRGASVTSPTTPPSAYPSGEAGIGGTGSMTIGRGPDPEPREDPSARGGDGTTLGSDSRLNAKYTFDTFVIGSSNRFAQAAASAVAEAPAKAYNPLFIYGGSGLGKTHLLHAVGHYAQNLYPGIEVRYVNSEEFTNDFINSIQSGQFGKAQEFHRRYRDIDILLIDDIQFLQRAPETMEAFFHTFNTLHNADKQIVITSDLPPKQLGGFEDRMRSRFEMGLMTDVQPPDLETRIAILRKKVEMEGTQEVPRDVLEYIASRISTNIRELEGALIRVQALHSLSRQPMDVTLAESVLKDLLAHDNGAEITATTIIAQTASYFGLTVDQITGGARTRVLVTARQIAMYLCRELTDMPLIRIGEEFGGRDHTTVMHANKKISELMKERRAIFNQVTELTARIKNSSANQV